jgi:NADH dehydrogenase
MAAPANTTERPHVVIVGAGFAGLSAAKELARAPVDVTLVDRRNHHLFQPLLYQVATAALNPSDIAYPIRSAVRDARNVRTLLGTVEHIDPATRTVTLDRDSLSYDYLVLATGATHTYFGNDSWREVAPGLKTIEDALEIRRRVLLAYEEAEREEDEDARRAWLTFVVIGGGPTGVELAGSLSEIGRHTIARDFRRIDPTSVRVILVEGHDRVLPPYPEDLSAKAQRQLEDLGVEVVTGKNAKELDASGVTVGDRRIHARTILWAAGVAASPLGKQLGAETDRAGRVVVEQDLSIAGHPEVFVVGDLAAIHAPDGSPVPGVAPAAAQAGKHVGRTIRRRLAGRPTTPFRYVDKGALATVGRARAVADLHWAKFSGYSAWVLWWAVHIFFLIGFRNRLLVMFGWVWNYLTFGRGARLITGSSKIGSAPTQQPDRKPSAPQSSPPASVR